MFPKAPSSLSGNTLIAGTSATLPKLQAFIPRLINQTEQIILVWPFIVSIKSLFLCYDRFNSGYGSGLNLNGNLLWWTGDDCRLLDVDGLHVWCMVVYAALLGDVGTLGDETFLHVWTLDISLVCVTIAVVAYYLWTWLSVLDVSVLSHFLLWFVIIILN
jgi:hypothetical protein